MGYDDIHNIVSKNQADAITEGGGGSSSGTAKGGVPQKATTYDWSYVYDPAGHPHAPVHIGNRTFSYDLNGNQTGWTNDNNGTRRTLLWDEENRISQIDDNGERNYYTYDAAGERTIKVSRQGQTVYVNQYYVVRNRSIVSKHIFANNTRIATHMEMGNGNTGAYRGNGGNGGGSNGGSGNGAQGHADNGNAYAYGQDQQHGQSGQDHGQGNASSSQGQADNGNGQGSGNGHASQGHGNSGNAGNGNSNGAGTVDTGEASVDTSNLPGNSGAGLENALSNGQGHKYGIYKHLDREGDTASNGEIVSSTVAGGTTTVNGQSSFLYYYHPDHLGSTGFVTDGNGKLYEHMEYFPFGESWVDEHSNTLRTPYLFTGKEFDLETGLYYFGARYYDPKTSVWQSADPILGRYLDGKPSQGVFDSLNLAVYSYGHLDPLEFLDPDGRANRHHKSKPVQQEAWVPQMKPVNIKNLSGDIYDHAESQYDREKCGMCAKKYRQGWERNGGSSVGRPDEAKDYGKWLEAVGWREIGSGVGAKDYKELRKHMQDADTTVFQGGPHGHIEIYHAPKDKMASDYRQNQDVPPSDRNSPFKIYRYFGPTIEDPTRMPPPIDPPPAEPAKPFTYDNPSHLQSPFDSAR